MALTSVGSIAVSPRSPTSFDHGDVHLESGRIFVAHTAAGSVEVIDGVRHLHMGTIPGCPEASGVLCAQDENLVFAAARGAGKVLVIDADSQVVRKELASGPRPNGLAWDDQRKLLLAADVGDFSARLLNPHSGETVGQAELPGRPRWCVYDHPGDRFLVNVSEPPCVAVFSVDPFRLAACWQVSSPGPHGLDLDLLGRRAFVACDGGHVVALDLTSGNEVGSVAITGPPDAIWYNSERRLLYVAIGKPGLVEVIDTTTMVTWGQVVTEIGAHTTAFDRSRQQLAVFLPATCRVALYRDA